jgi:hypothetical protein
MGDCTQLNCSLASTYDFFRTQDAKLNSFYPLERDNRVKRCHGEQWGPGEKVRTASSSVGTALGGSISRADDYPLSAVPGHPLGIEMAS